MNPLGLVIVDDFETVLRRAIHIIRDQRYEHQSLIMNPKQKEIIEETLFPPTEDEVREKFGEDYL